MSSSFSGASGFVINNSTFYQVNLGSSVNVCICCNPTLSSIGQRELYPEQPYYPLHEPIVSLRPEIMQIFQRQIPPGADFPPQWCINPVGLVYPTPTPHFQYYVPSMHQGMPGLLHVPSSMQPQPPCFEGLPVGLPLLPFKIDQAANGRIISPPMETSAVIPAVSEPLLYCQQQEENSVPLGQHSLHRGYVPYSTKTHPPPPLHHFPSVDPYAQAILEDTQLRQLSYGMLWGENQLWSMSTTL